MEFKIKHKRIIHYNDKEDKNKTEHNIGIEIALLNKNKYFIEKIDQFSKRKAKKFLKEKIDENKLKVEVEEYYDIEVLLTYLIQEEFKEEIVKLATKIKEKSIRLAKDLEQYLNGEEPKNKKEKIGVEELFKIGDGVVYIAIGEKYKEWLKEEGYNLFIEDYRIYGPEKEEVHKGEKLTREPKNFSFLTKWVSEKKDKYENWVIEKN